MIRDSIKYYKKGLYNKGKNPLVTIKYFLKAIRGNYYEAFLELGNYYNRITDNKDLCIKYYNKSILYDCANKNFAYIELAKLNNNFLDIIIKPMKNKCQAAYVEYCSFLMKNNDSEFKYKINRCLNYKIKNETKIELYYIYLRYCYNNYMINKFKPLSHKIFSLFNDDDIVAKLKLPHKKIKKIYMLFIKIYNLTNDKYYIMNNLNVIKKCFNKKNFNSFLYFGISLIILDNINLANNYFNIIKANLDNLTTKDKYTYYIYKYVLNYYMNKDNYLEYIKILFIDNDFKPHINKIMYLLHYLFKLKNNSIKFVNNINITCPITYATCKKGIELNCNHVFGLDIFIWLFDKKSCPLCRKNIGNDL